MPLSNSAIHSAFHTFALAQCTTPGFKALSSRAGCCTGSCRSELCRLSLVSALIPRAELPCLKDTHLCRSPQSSPAPSPSAENSADTTNLSQKLQDSWEKNRHPQKRHHRSALFALLHSCRDSGWPIPSGCAFHSTTMISLGSSPHCLPLKIGRAHV